LRWHAVARCIQGWAVAHLLGPARPPTSVRWAGPPLYSHAAPSTTLPDFPGQPPPHKQLAAPTLATSMSITSLCGTPPPLPPVMPAAAAQGKPGLGLTGKGPPGVGWGWLVGWWCGGSFLLGLHGAHRLGQLLGRPPSPAEASTSGVAVPGAIAARVGEAEAGTGPPAKAAARQPARGVPCGGRSCQSSSQGLCRRH
jgi:hypothetical protein